MSEKASRGLRDFPASEPFGRLLDEGPGKGTPPEKLPSDKKSVDNAVANLERLTGLRPPTEADQQPLPPVKIFVGHDPRPATVPEQPTGSSPGKRLEQAIDKTNQILNQRGQVGEIARKQLLTPDAGHEAREASAKHLKQLRKNMSLPEKAPTRKQILAELVTLTPVDIEFLKTRGYNRERVQHYSILTLEKMLQDLHQHQEVIRNTKK